MDICFYNLNHIGDIYFSSLFINIICKLNKQYKFYYYFINGDIFFKNITNIQRLYPIEDSYLGTLINGSPPEKHLNNNVLEFLLTNKMESIGAKNIQVNGKNILFINTWCASEYLKYRDYDILNAIEAYKNLILLLQLHHNVSLSFEINKPLELIEHINEENSIYKKNNYIIENDSIFIFNFKPRSLIFDLHSLNNIILNLSKSKKIILSSYDTLFDNNINIKFIDKDYNIYPTPNCMNLLNIWEIAIKCDKILILPTGSSWTFLHKLNVIKQNQIFILNNTHYANLLNVNINFLLGETKNLIKVTM
uniref:Glycosyltransferase n=1 Tax=viral metagenome TaxID=1070528 RepID=A0A6C0H4E1_9ZZZZ